MEDKEFFNNHFINRTISFASPDSQWTLIKKLREFNDQRDPEMFLSSPHKPGGAYGTFLCSNPANPTEQNIMRIIMQVPYAGSEIAIHAERARQARDRLPTPGQEMLNAYSTLTKLGSDFTPRLVNVKWAEQTDRDIVPGGSIVYLLLEKLPGRQLGLWFWDLHREERDRVRGAFKVAWTRCSRAGFSPWGSLSKLFWDGVTGRIYIYNFVDVCRAKPNYEWMDWEWVVWGLAVPPRGYRCNSTTVIHSEMEGWKL